MNINVDLLKHFFNNKMIATKDIAKNINISEQKVSDIRSSNDFSDLTLNEAIYIQKWLSDNYSLSYDYSTLIEEFLNDYPFLNNSILVVRKYDELLDYGVIIDYMNVDEFKESKQYKVEYLNKKDVLDEMKDWNALL